MAPASHADFDELVAGFSLAALEPEDEQRVMEHLPSCARCERALVEHLETAAQLAYEQPAPPPPPELFAAIRARLAPVGSPDGPALAPRPAPAGAWTALAEAASLSASGPGQPVQLRPTLPRHRRAGSVRTPWRTPGRPGPGRHRPARPSRRTALLASAAAVLALVVGLGGWNLQLRDQRASSDLRAAQLETALTTLGDRGTVVPLSSPSGALAAVAAVQPDSVNLLVESLPKNDASRTTYVLWSQVKDGPVNAVTAFDVTRNQQVLRNVPLQHSTASGLLLMVTLEPGRSAPDHTQQAALASGRAA